MSLGNFVIRLQFVIVKRLEAFVLGWRVHVGQQPMRIAEAGDVVSGDHAQTHTRKEIGHREMIPAFRVHLEPHRILAH